MEQKKTIGDVLSSTNKIVKHLQENRLSLHITRIPAKTRKEFMDWADEEFCSDYGFALKFLWDGLPKSDMLNALDILQDHNERLLALEEKSSTEVRTDKKTIKMCNGRTIKVNKDE